MNTLGPFLTGSYDYRLVALSVFIAILASYAALDLAGRVTSRKGGRACCGWLAERWRWGRYLVHALRWDACLPPARPRAV